MKVKTLNVKYKALILILSDQTGYRRKQEGETHYQSRISGATVLQNYLIK